MEQKNRPSKNICNQINTKICLSNCRNPSHKNKIRLIDRSDDLSNNTFHIQIYRICVPLIVGTLDRQKDLSNTACKDNQCPYLKNFPLAQLSSV